MSYAKTIVHQDQKDRVVFHQRRTLRETALAGVRAWTRLDPPLDGRSFYIRNESTTAVLDVSFMEQDPTGQNDPSFFTLSARGAIDFERRMSFVPRSIWVHQNENNQPVYWEVIDEMTLEDIQKDEEGN